MNGLILMVFLGLFRIVLPLTILILIGEWVLHHRNGLRINS